MPRDYKSHRRPRQKRSVHGFVWLLAGLAIGLFVAFLVYLDKQPTTGTSFGDAVKQELEKIKPAQKKTAGGKKQETKFNFYTILPELEVLIPEAELRPPKTGGVDSNKQYALQAGSFRIQKDAETLKARLALLGLQANIQRVTVNREEWHRVRIGPYKNTRDLYQDLNQLHQHDINAMAMELK